MKMRCQPLNTSCQHTLSTHLSTYPIKPIYQHTLVTHPRYALYHPTYQPTLSTHPRNPSLLPLWLSGGALCIAV